MNKEAKWNELQSVLCENSPCIEGTSGRSDSSRALWLRSYIVWVLSKSQRGMSPQPKTAEQKLEYVI